MTSAQFSARQFTLCIGVLMAYIDLNSMGRELQFL